MTRILLVSDSHGYDTFMEMMLDRHSEVDCVFHLGDGASDLPRLRRYAKCPVLAVRGNCDGFGEEPAERQYEAEGERLFLTHGHLYRVKYRLDALAYRAEELGAQAALYGHTHRQALDRDGGVLLINPGSARVGDYGLLTLEAGKMDVQLLNISTQV